MEEPRGKRMKTMSEGNIGGEGALKPARATKTPKVRSATKSMPNGLHGEASLRQFSHLPISCVGIVVSPFPLAVQTQINPIYRDKVWHMVHGARLSAVCAVGACGGNVINISMHTAPLVLGFHC